MPRKRRNDLIAGSFIVMSSSLLLVLLFWIGSFEGFFRTFKQVDVVFQDVKGLRPGDPVYFLGYLVGKVDAVRIAPNADRVQLDDGDKDVPVSRVLVTLAIPTETWNLLKVDSPVVVDRSITGNLSVHIGEGHSDEYLSGLETTEAQRLRGDVVFDVDETAAKLTQAIEKANAILTDLAVILANLRESGHLQSIFEDIADTAKILKKHTGPLTDRVGSIADQMEGILSDNRGDLKAAITNVAESSKTLKDFLNRRLDHAADSLDEALTSAKQVTAAANRLVSRNSSRVDVIVESLEEAASNADGIFAEIRRRPWRLFYEPKPGELESLGIYDAAWAYNLTAKELNNTLGHLSSLTKTDPDSIDSTLVQRTIDEVEAKLRRQRETEEAFYALLKKRIEE